MARNGSAPSSVLAALPLTPKVSFKTAHFAGLKSLGSVPAISGHSPPGLYYRLAKQHCCRVFAL